jgi:hypothetical protein
MISRVANLFRSPRSGEEYVGKSGLFPEIDVPAISRSLRLEQLGRERGARNQPASDAGTFDDVEQQIIARIETYKTRAHEIYLGHLRTYNARIGNLGLKTLLANVLAPADKAMGDFKAQLQDGPDQLHQLRERVIRIETDLADFKRKHGLTRMAHYPSSTFLHWSVVAFLALLESFINSSFFGQGDEFGLIGGWIKGILLAFANVLLGLWIGWKGFRQRLRREFLWKAVGYASAIIYLPLLFWINVSAAHFREAMLGGNPETADQMALQAIALTFPLLNLALTEFSSWMLIALGCVCSILVAIDGWKMDDPYPGYGQISKRRDQYQDEYARKKRELLQKLEQIRDLALREMKGAGKGVEDNKANHYAYVASRQRLPHEFVQHLTLLEACGNQLLSVYRNANRIARGPTSAAPPAHFGSMWIMQRPPGVDTAFDGSDVGEGEVNNVLAQIPAKQALVHDQYNAALQQYLRIDQLTSVTATGGALHV